jgi:Capsule polysaccharide biosynthesis protein
MPRTNTINKLHTILKQHIAFFITHPLFQRHFATDLELIQNHLNNGDDVTVLYCDAELLACDINTYHEPGQCLLCRKTRNIGLSLLSTHGQGTIHEYSFLNLTPANRVELESVQTEFTSLSELQAYTFENFDIGMAALSSIVSFVMNAELDMKVHKNLIKRYILSGIIAYRSIQNFLHDNHIDKFYFFNGRMATVRAIMRACESAGVPFTIHEAAAGNATYSLFDNSLPHSIGLMTRMMHENWEQGSTNVVERQRKADEWFQSRAKGIKVNGYSFVENQEQGLLPQNWDTQKKNIVIFNSADFEFVWVSEEYQHHIYHDQLDGIRSIIESLASYQDQFHVYLRIHPNLATIENELRPLLAMQYQNLTTILPTDRTSSYALIEHAAKVITFGSTVGIEAPYWGKPSILGGKALYQNLGATYNPNSHDELIDLLLDDNLLPKSIEGVLMYGYFYSSFGIPFQHYDPKDFFSGTFNGREPFANRWLFRAFTAYKQLVPKVLQHNLNEQYIYSTLKRSVGDIRQATKLLQ